VIIDGHIHAGYWSPGRFLGRGVPFAELERCLEQCSLDGAVLTTTDLRDNQAVAAFARQPKPKRYWFFPWVNPAAPDDLVFLKQHRRDIHGIKLHPSVDRIRVTDDRAKPYVSFAADQGLPVIVHCGRWQEMSSYAFALEAAGRNPAVSFVLSHMGGDTPELETATVEGACASGLANVFLGIEGVREYWAVQLAVDRMGADKVIFGSDYPLGHPRMYLGLVDALDITEGERAAILGGNMLRLLGETSR
jgi:predicted TIM-barrel fold metal-dependent hydrolase